MLKWYGEKVKKEIYMNISARIKIAGEIVEKEAKQSMPINFETKLPDGDIARSAPGEPPYRQTDELYKSIFSEMSRSGLSVKVGTPVKYGKYLEFGTLKMKWRPWLVPALAKSMSKIKTLFAIPIKGGLFSIKDTNISVDRAIELEKGTSGIIES